MKLKDWYVTFGDDFCRAHGVVYGNERFPDGSSINTSEVNKLDVSDGKLSIVTCNNTYELETPNIFTRRESFEEFFDKFSDVETKEKFMRDFSDAFEKGMKKLEENANLPEASLLTEYMQLYEKGNHEQNARVLEELSPLAAEIEPYTLMIAVKTGGSMFYCGIFKNGDGELENVRRYIHSGMFVDSVLLMVGEYGDIVARYFPKDSTVQFYNQIYANGDENCGRILILNTSSMDIEVDFTNVGGRYFCKSYSAVTNFPDDDDI